MPNFQRQRINNNTQRIRQTRLRKALLKRKGCDTSLRHMPALKKRATRKTRHVRWQRFFIYKKLEKNVNACVPLQISHQSNAVLAQIKAIFEEVCEGGMGEEKRTSASLFPHGHLQCKNPKAFGFSPHTIVFSTIGGPALCGQVIADLSLPNHECVYYFQDNLEPIADPILLRLQARPFRIVILSKSGQTLETRLQAEFWINFCRTHGYTPRKHIHVFTAPLDATSSHKIGANRNDRYDSPLAKLARAHHLPVFPLSPHIDGRFSMFSKVGHAMASYLNVNAQHFFEGGQRYLQTFGQKELFRMQQHYRAMQQKKVHILWVYDARLVSVAMWWHQLIGESLGKEGMGLTPCVVLGPKDQHSQLQLYLGGSRHHYFTFLTCPTATQDSFEQIADFERVRRIQMQSVQAVFEKEDIPYRTFEVPASEVHAMGAFCMHIMIEMLFFGVWSGINPFGQDDIESVKRATWRAIKEIKFFNDLLK